MDREIQIANGASGDGLRAEEGSLRRGRAVDWRIAPRRRHRRKVTASHRTSAGGKTRQGQHSHQRTANINSRVAKYGQIGDLGEGRGLIAEPSGRVHTPHSIGGADASGNIYVADRGAQFRRIPGVDGRGEISKKREIKDRVPIRPTRIPWMGKSVDFDGPRPAQRRGGAPWRSASRRGPTQYLYKHVASRDASTSWSIRKRKCRRVGQVRPPNENSSAGSRGWPAPRR